MNRQDDPTPYERIEELLIESRTRPFTPPEREELNASLRHDAGARCHAARFLLDDTALAEDLRAAQVENLMRDDASGLIAGTSEDFAPPARRPAWQWRPLTSLAAGLVLGLFCASMVWAYAVPRAAELVNRVVPLANGDFESNTQPLADGVPRGFGVWSGGSTRIVESEQGIQPRSGEHMLKIIRSNSRTDSASPERPAGDIMQLVDLRSFKEETASGNAVLEVSASANTSETESGRYRFGVRAFAFSGRPEDLGSDTPEILQSALAASHNGVVLGARPEKWQTVTARLLVPAEADFAMIKLTVSQREAFSGPVEFAGHYIDDVKLLLRVQPSSSVRGSRKANRSR